MKNLYLCLVASLTLFLCSVSCVAQDQAPLNSEWLAADYKSIELISILASPGSLTTQKIRDVLDVGDSGEEKDLGFGASTFYIGKGHGHTSLNVEGFVFAGTIGFYKVGIRASAATWPRIREHIIDLWKQNNGPDFKESEDGLVHTETNEDVFLRYKSAVSAELGEMKLAEIPDELKEFFDYLTSPIANRALGDRRGEAAMNALVHANRIDLIENVLRGFNPSGRVYAALQLLKLSRENQLVLSSDTIGVIAKVSNLNISITIVHGCLVSSLAANEILNPPDDSEAPYRP